MLNKIDFENPLDGFYNLNQQIDALKGYSEYLNWMLEFFELVDLANFKHYSHIPTDYKL